MANIAGLLVCTFGNFLVPFLVVVHAVNNLDLGDEQGYENEGYIVIKKTCVNLYVVTITTSGHILTLA